MGANFPDIQKPNSRQRTVSRPQLKSEFESGHGQIRAKGTRAKRSWTLSWSLLSIVDWNTLSAHFAVNSGTSFIIDKDMIFEPQDYTVVYSIDELTAKSTSTKGRYSVEIKIEEL